MRRNTPHPTNEGLTRPPIHLCIYTPLLAVNQATNTSAKYTPTIHSTIYPAPLPNNTPTTPQNATLYPPSPPSPLPPSSPCYGCLAVSTLTTTTVGTYLLYLRSQSPLTQTGNRAFLGVFGVAWLAVGGYRIIEETTTLVEKR